MRRRSLGRGRADRIYYNLARPDAGNEFQGEITVQLLFLK